MSYLNKFILSAGLYIGAYGCASTHKHVIDLHQVKRKEIVCGTNKSVSVIINGDDEERHVSNVDRALEYYSKVSDYVFLIDAKGDHLVNDEQYPNVYLFDSFVAAGQNLSCFDTLTSSNLYVTGHGFKSGSDSGLVFDDRKIKWQYIIHTLHSINSALSLNVYADLCNGGSLRSYIANQDGMFYSLASSYTNSQCQKVTPRLLDYLKGGDKGSPVIPGTPLFARTMKDAFSAYRQEVPTSIPVIDSLKTDSLVDLKYLMTQDETFYVSISADWCGACKTMETSFEMAKIHHPEFKFLVFDYKHEKIAEILKLLGVKDEIRAFPALFQFKPKSKRFKSVKPLMTVDSIKTFFIDQQEILDDFDTFYSKLRTTLTKRMVKWFVEKGLTQVELINALTRKDYRVLRRSSNLDNLNIRIKEYLANSRNKNIFLLDAKYLPLLEKLTINGIDEFNYFLKFFKRQKYSIPELNEYLALEYSILLRDKKITKSDVKSYSKLIKKGLRAYIFLKVKAENLTISQLRPITKYSFGKLPDFTMNFLIDLVFETLRFDAQQDDYLKVYHTIFDRLNIPMPTRIVMFNQLSTFFMESPTMNLQLKTIFKDTTFSLEVQNYIFQLVGGDQSKISEVVLKSDPKVFELLMSDNFSLNYDDLIDFLNIYFTFKDDKAIYVLAYLKATNKGYNTQFDIKFTKLFRSNSLEQIKFKYHHTTYYTSAFGSK